MDFGFLFKSIKRAWFTFTALVLLGAVLGYSLASRGGGMYESNAVLLVSPPSESRVQVSFTNDPDRYVLGQLSVLRSATTAEQVANSLGDGETADGIQRMTKFVHSPKTDIVTVTVSTPDAERSRRIADAYLKNYFDILKGQVVDTRASDIEGLDAQLADINTQLAAVDQQLADAMKPYLPKAATLGNGSYAPIPAVEQVAPELVTRRETLLSEYNQVIATKTSLQELEVNNRLRVTSEVVQQATLPDAPTSESAMLLTIVGAIAGAFVGLLVVAVLARMSSVALDEEDVDQLLGRAPVGEFPSTRVYGKDRRNVIGALPERSKAFAEALAVQAEASAPGDATFTVLVAGAERSAGTTTLAGALARQFAVQGSRVVLVDADARDSELSRLFGAGRAGIPALLAGTSGAARNIEALSPTPVPNLSVLSIGAKAMGNVLTRRNVPTILDRTAELAHVVVVDGGPLLDSASTVQLTQMADVVVLAMPVDRTHTRTLTTIAARLQGRRGELLPVFVPASRRRLGRSGSPDVSDGVVVESVDAPFTVDTEPVGGARRS